MAGDSVCQYFRAFCFIVSTAIKHVDFTDKRVFNNDADTICILCPDTKAMLVESFLFIRLQFFNNTIARVNVGDHILAMNSPFQEHDSIKKCAKNTGDDRRDMSDLVTTLSIPHDDMKNANTG